MLFRSISWNPIIYDSSENIVSEDIFDSSGKKLTTEKYKLTIHDLSNNTGNQIYRFYVYNDPINGEQKELNINSLKDDPKSFIFDNLWNNVFLYGKEVDDFHILDKQKLFALNFSATQEIDRIQQAEKIKLQETQTQLQQANEKINTLESLVASLTERITALENN